MQARTWGAERGAHWLGDGWRLFMASPGLWIVLSIVFLMIFFALNFVPFIGMLAGLLLAPALSGGMLLAARDAEQGRPLDLGRLFEPLVDEQRRGDILILGLLYLGACIASMMFAIIVFVVGVGLPAVDLGMLYGQGDIDPAAAQSMGVGAVLAVLLWLSLALLVAALFFYATPLVALGAVPPIQAIALGVRGLLRNWLPLLVLGLIWTALAVAATLPLMLGWLVLGPLTWTAWYASYRDIFVAPGPERPADAQCPAGTGSAD